MRLRTANTKGHKYAIGTQFDHNTQTYDVLEYVKGQEQARHTGRSEAQANALFDQIIRDARDIDGINYAE